MSKPATKSASLLKIVITERASDDYAAELVWGCRRDSYLYVISYRGISPKDALHQVHSKFLDDEERRIHSEFIGKWKSEELNLL